jgi:hypothetical protein
VVITLLITTFVVAFAVASLVVLIFNRPIENILRQVLPAELSPAWAKYLRNLRMQRCQAACFALKWNKHYISHAADALK